MEKNINISDNKLYHFKANKYKNVNCRIHENLNMEFVIVLSGVLDILIGNKKYEVKPAQVAFIQPFERHSYTSNQDNESIILVFSNEFVECFYNYLKNHRNTKSVFDMSPDMFEFITKFINEWGKTNSDVLAQAILAPICYEAKEKLDFVEGKNRLDDTLLCALEYINQHFDDDITLDGVAKSVGVHPVTLSKKFGEYIKISFKSYVNYQRCCYALKMMIVNGTSCSDAAYSAGFGSIRSFNRVFLDIYGVTPSEFKQSPEKIEQHFYH